VPTSTTLSGGGACGVRHCRPATIRWRRAAATAAVIAASRRGTPSGRQRLLTSWRALPLLARQRMEVGNGACAGGSFRRRPVKSRRRQWAVAAPVALVFSALLERVPAKRGGGGGGARHRRPRGNGGQQWAAAALVSLANPASYSEGGVNDYRAVAVLEAFAHAGTRGFAGVESRLFRPR